ncbi:hypothetical protein C4D60_Mb01t18780 [Musa balbisiana]|uniref:Uncharacterized protein n=1 Tax=Musa balbisiana TaxID=52838 RepID=A0A4S8JN76_MUSBA|nr:hypothetical protein C4D60_Mb01t18780 [Musa balbisiana]
MIHCMTIDEDIFIVFFTRGGRDLLVPEHVVYSIIYCRGFLYVNTWKGSSCSRTCRLSQQGQQSTPSSNWEKRSHLGTPLVSPKLMPLLGVVLCLVHYLDAQARSIRMKIALFRWKKQAIPGFQDEYEVGFCWVLLRWMLPAKANTTLFDH